MAFSSYFSLAELTHSRTAQAEGISNQPDEAATLALQALCRSVLDPVRERLGSTIAVTSGFRGTVLNKRLGGEPASQHLLGQAADIQARSVTVLRLFKLAIELGLPFDQIIYEAKSATSQWVHVSYRQNGNRGEIRRAVFAANGQALRYPLLTAQQALALPELASTRRGAKMVLDFDEVADEPPQARARKRAAPGKKPDPKTP